MDTQKSSVGLGIFTAIASSLCCITPLLAIFAGSSSLAGTFSFLEPARPYLFGITLLALGFAWYQNLKPVAQDDCGCEISKISFFQTRKFLGIVTAFALLMLTFPTYAHIFYPVQKNEIPDMVDEQNISKIEFEVTGMTCNGCEAHVEQAVSKLDGVFKAKASYKNKNAIVTFDHTKTDLKSIEEAIRSTSYQVGSSQIIQ